MSARGFRHRLRPARPEGDPADAHNADDGGVGRGGGKAPGPALLSAEGISKSFGATRALDKCELEIRRGEIHALVGENGSGKSTLIKILSGVFAADSGKLHWRGDEVRFGRPRQAQVAGIATVFQETLIAEELSVRDNIFAGSGGLMRRAHGRAAENSIGSRVLTDLGLPGISLDRPLWRLPLSQRQIVTIARSLARPWQLLILDEPTSALDVEERDGLFNFLRGIREQGNAGILLVSHRMDEITALADRATVLRNGKSVASLTREQINSESLVQLMSDAGAASGQAAPPNAAAAERAERQAGKRRLVVEDVTLRRSASPFSVEICDGEVVGVAGLAGHGQETFLEVVAGLRRPYSGRVSLDHNGSLVPVRGFREAFQHGIAYVPRDRKQEGLFAPLSVLDNVAMPNLSQYSRGGVLQRGRLRRDMTSLLDSLQLRGGTLQTPVARLSGGNQQKVLLGRWLAVSPKLLVLNDPMRGVDLGVKRQFYALLRQLSAEGMAVLLLSTEVEELVAVARRVIVFHEQSLSAVVPGSADSRASIVSAMFGRSGNDG